MSFDGDEFGMDEDCGYDDSYDPADDIYAGTAQCDDGSDRDFDDRIEGEDIEGEMGAGEVEPVETDEEDDEIHNSYDNDDPHDGRHME
jgi:hypothetical protein